MKHYFKKNTLSAVVSLTLLGGAGVAKATVNVQCPGDDNGNAIWDGGETQPTTNTKCMHLVAGDGFTNMSDSNPMYIFGYADKTGVLPQDVIADGILAARWPGTTIELNEGDEFYLSLTNVGTVIRPDLFDPHTVHFHGFPNAATVFDGVPEVSVSINMGATLTYYYNIVEPGTYIYHCHVEATEHMEMGMLANLYVHPAQDGTAYPDASNGVTYTTFAYNDGDGSTGFDVEAPLQVSSFDADFHDASVFVQPLPFADMEGNYPMFNGRGYPDTIGPDTGFMGPPTDNTIAVDGHPPGKITGAAGEILNNGEESQDMGSLVSVPQGQRLLLRLSNVGLDRFWTLTAPGLTMKIVGTGARQMRGVDGKNLYREAASVNFGGGETHDVLIDTAGVAPGTYFLHATELHQMSNKTQLDGGMITEIVVN